MTRKEAKQLLPIIQAFADGKKIQYRVSPKFPRPNNRDISYLKEWFDLDEDKCDGFSCDGTIDYRIKPEPKYRPFKSQEEYLDEMLKHQPFGWVVNKKSTIMHNICGIGLNYIYVDDMTTSFIDAFAEYKFIDGTPFGIKEEL